MRTTEDTATAPGRPAREPGAAGGGGWSGPDARRALQLVLATFWLFDGILQLQSFFFTKSFGLKMISGTSSGDPSVIARPITWSAAAIGHHAVLADTVFASIQIAIAFAIAWRPTVKWGLVASLVWAAAVWWVGEGLGGIVNGTANPINGAPGPVLLYGLLAVLLWPEDRIADRPTSFVAGRWVGEPVAKALWVLLWGSMALFAVLGANRSPSRVGDLIGAQANGEPGWLAALDRHLASAADHNGLLVSTIVAALLVAVAVGVLLPTPLSNASVVVAAASGLVFWVVGQNFGALFTNGASDLDSGPLLVLLAVSYWRWPRAMPSLHTALDRRLGLERA